MFYQALEHLTGTTKLAKTQNQQSAQQKTGENGNRRGARNIANTAQGIKEENTHKHTDAATNVNAIENYKLENYEHKAKN